jgi:hypothetical protein
VSGTVRARRKTMRKALLLALVVVLVLVLGGVAGCGKIVEKAVEDATGVSVDEDDGSVTIEGEDGTSITVDEEGTELPEGYPSDVPVYDGTITTAWETSDEKGTTYSIAITTEDSTADVVDWYKAELEDGGWKILSTFKDASSGMISAEKDDLTFYLAAGGDEGESTDISQIVGPKN